MYTSTMTHSDTHVHVHLFLTAVLARNLKFGFWQKFIPSKRASQEKQNGEIFSFVAPSSEEFMSAERNLIQMPYYSPWFTARN